jgi:hypothetical protein
VRIKRNPPSGRLPFRRPRYMHQSSSAALVIVRRSPTSRAASVVFSDHLSIPVSFPHLIFSVCHSRLLCATNYSHERLPSYSVTRPTPCMDARCCPLGPTSPGRWPCSHHSGGKSGDASPRPRLLLGWTLGAPRSHGYCLVLLLASRSCLLWWGCSSERPLPNSRPEPFFLLDIFFQRNAMTRSKHAWLLKRGENCSWAPPDMRHLFSILGCIRPAPIDRIICTHVPCGLWCGMVAANHIAPSHLQSVECWVFNIYYVANPFCATHVVLSR